MSDVDPVEHDAAVGRLHEPEDRPAKCRFAAPALAYNPKNLARFQGE